MTCELAWEAKPLERAMQEQVEQLARTYAPGLPLCAAKPCSAHERIVFETAANSAVALRSKIGEQGVDGGCVGKWAGAARGWGVS